jgi:hypothetical protein
MDKKREMHFQHQHDEPEAVAHQGTGCYNQPSPKLCSSARAFPTFAA